MIKIDASIGYGQVLRTALALSVLTNTPIKVYNIRIRRPRPGLMRQHLTGVLEIAKLSHANVKGAKLGSTEIEFKPKFLDVPKEIFIDIKTAGSITLLLQTILPPIIFSGKETKIRIIGGTDVRGSPTIMYYKHVFFYYLKKIGINIDIEIKQHGFYPKGGGEVVVYIGKNDKLNPISLTKRKGFVSLSAWSIATKNLQKFRVAERQLKGLESIVGKILGEKSFAYVDSYSTGTSLLSIAEYENCVLGEDGLGERGKRAELVGEEVGRGIKQSIQSNACLDKYMSDQLLLYLSLLNGKSQVTIESKTEHFETNMKVCKMFLGEIFNLEGNRLTIKGVGYNG